MEKPKANEAIELDRDQLLLLGGACGTAASNTRMIGQKWSTLCPQDETCRSDAALGAPAQKP